MSDALVRALWISVLAQQLENLQLDPAMVRIALLLESNLEQLTTIDEVARLVGLSRSRLHERFIATYGEPPMTWLRRHRMQHAARLIRGGLTVAQTADRMGYASETAFRKAFKRVMHEPARRRPTAS